MTDQQILTHAINILNSARIRGKYVFLCEGDISNIFDNNIHSPSSLRKLEHLPDSSFYKKCLNTNIQKYKLPSFFNCAGRTDVIKVYHKLLELVDEEESQGRSTYLDKEKLFVIIDLDLQNSKVDETLYTEDIYLSLYDETKIIQTEIISHKVFVTGLIHKEAYFLLPIFQDVIENYKIQLKYGNSQICLPTIYQEILNDSYADRDLNSNLSRVLDRFSQHKLNTIDDLVSLANQKLNQNELEYLFTFRKVKPYWERITSEESSDDEKLREQIVAEIASKISTLNDNNFHLTAIFNKIIQ
ncbi:hypothetical protein [Aliarcobacter butzleri]|uniref:hypothetical protein n=1 Tax=Aliarcobacter butzleri TaxID=28197 RepID=UPI00344E31B8